MEPASLGTLWSTHEYTEHLLVTTKPYCLSPTHRYLHGTGTEPNSPQPCWKIPCGIAQRNIRKEKADIPLTLHTINELLFRYLFSYDYLSLMSPE
jgi:hypothetical protein